MTTTAAEASDAPEGTAPAAAAILPPAPSLTRPVVLTALALTVLFTALCLQWSLAQGRLSQDSIYDDCAYLYDGGHRLRLLYEQGFGAFVADAIKHPPHAPFSAYGASLAFALFGMHDWSPYVLNGLIVFAALLLVGHLAREVSLRWRAALMALLLTLPIAISAVHDFRPDSICALLSVIGMCLVAEAGVYRTGRARRRTLIAGGVAFGLALWAKPPVFALTLVTAGLATGGAWLAANLFDPPRNVRRAAASALGIGGAVALPCALVAAPYYAVNGLAVVRYFIFNSFDKNTQFWKVPGGWAGAVHFYVFGEAAELFMGRTLYLWVGLYGLALAWIAWRRHGRELTLQGLLLLLTLVSLAAVLYGRIQNPFFGMTWMLLLAISCLRAWAFVLSTLSLARWRGVLAALALVALGAADLLLLQLRHSWTGHNPSVDALVGRGHSINQHILDDISRELAQRGGGDAPATTFLTVTGYINEGTLRWMAFEENRPLVFSDLQLESRLAPFREKIAAADFVVSGEDRTGGVFQIMPPYRLRNELAALAADEARAGRLRLLDRYPTPEGGSYYLWINEERAGVAAGVFSPFSAWDGFMPFEGPYPQWHLGKVRWALGARSEFTFEAAAPGPARLDMWVRAQTPLHAQVLLDGNPVGGLEVPVEPEFRHVIVPVTLHAGANRFTFASPGEPPADPDGYHRAVLFSQLEVRPAP